MILRYFKYIFYRVYIWQCRVQPTEQFAAHIALVTIVFLSLAYISVFASAIGVFYPPILSFVFGQYSIEFLIAYFIIVGTVPYILYVRDGRYRKIIAPFHNLQETRIQKLVRGSMIVLNVVCLLVIFSVFAVIRHHYGNL